MRAGQKTLARLRLGVLKAPLRARHVNLVRSLDRNDSRLRRLLFSSHSSTPSGARLADL
jgi:hypothetical protein